MAKKPISEYVPPLQEEELEKYRWVPVAEVEKYYLTKTAHNGFVDYLLRVMPDI